MYIQHTTLLLPWSVEMLQTVVPPTVLPAPKFSALMQLWISYFTLLVIIIGPTIING